LAPGKLTLIGDAYEAAELVDLAADVPSDAVVHRTGASGIARR
jgi:hypothetical protein